MELAEERMRVLVCFRWSLMFWRCVNAYEYIPWTVAGGLNQGQALEGRVIG